MRARLVLNIVSTTLEVAAAAVVAIFILPRINIRIPVAALIAISLAWIAWSAFTYRKGTQALRRKPVASLVDMTGCRGRVARGLHPRGLVKVNGELWSARAGDGRRIDSGMAVVVTGKEGLTLVVRAEGLGRGSAGPADGRDDDHDHAGNGEAQA